MRAAVLHALATITLVCSAAAQSLSQQPWGSPTPRAQSEAGIVIPAGTMLHVRLLDPIDAYTVSMSNLFRATLASPLGANGQIVVGTGYDVEGRIVDVRQAGRFAGRPEVVLELSRLIIGNRYYELRTSRFTIVGESRGKRTAASVLLPAAIGAGLGALANGGEGAAIGAGVGGTVGAVGAATTDGRNVNLRPESLIMFTLEQPITVEPAPARGPEGDRPRLERRSEVPLHRPYRPAVVYPRIGYPVPYPYFNPYASTYYSSYFAPIVPVVPVVRFNYFVVGRRHRW